MKKIILSSMLAIATASSASAAGFYISPKVAYSHIRMDESRVEQKWSGTDWTEFSGNKHETWAGHANKVTPKLAFGYEFDTDKYGIVSIETEYSKTNSHINAMNGTYDFDGNTPNDTDTRTMTYGDSTLALNAKYGYKVADVVPFVTAGIGYTTIDSQNTFRSGTYWWNTQAQENNISWNIGAGVEIPVTEKVAFTLAYTYTNLGNVQYSNWMYHENPSANQHGIERHFDSSVDLAKHEIAAGIKFQF